MTTIVAAAGKAVVTLNKTASESEGGLVLLDHMRKPTAQAVVVASSVPDVVAGDTVLLNGEYAGSSFTVDGVDYVSLVAEEIVAVLE